MRLLGPWLSLGGRKIAAVSAKPKLDDLGLLKTLVDAGQLKSVIDRRYPLAQAAEAIRYVEQGHASGKVIVEI